MLLAFFSTGRFLLLLMRHYVSCIYSCSFVLKFFYYTVWTIDLLQSKSTLSVCQRHAQHTKRTLAAVRIQTTWRRYTQQQKYRCFLQAVVTVQVNGVHWLTLDIVNCKRL